MSCLVKSRLCVLVTAMVAAGCPAELALVPDASAPPAPDSSSPPPSDGPPLTGPADGILAIDVSRAAQVIDGFGASNAWQALPAEPAARARVVELLFSKSRGAGLSILRNRIPFREQSGDGASIPDYNDRFVVYADGQNYQYVVNADGSKTFTLNWGNWDLANTRSLLSAIRGLGEDGGLTTIFSSPWTPPNNATTNWKRDVPDVVNFPQVGGTLDPERYADYADLLADYANGFAANMGMPLSALSVQNEPDWKANYESCAWTADQVHDFLVVLKAELAKKGMPAGLRIMAPEGSNFEESLVVPSLDDPDTAALVGVVAVHQYDLAEANFAAKRLPTVERHGKPLWMTEVSKGTANNSSISDGLYWARMIHTDLTLAQVNAFNYWWLWASSAAGEGLLGVDGSTIVENKRLFTLGQFSRFVRPGWVRVVAETAPIAGVLTSVFRDAARSKLAVVLINATADTRSVDLQMTTGTYGALGAWRTSATESLSEVNAVTIEANRARVQLVGQSVTTVYGDITP